MLPLQEVKTKAKSRPERKILSLCGFHLMQEEGMWGLSALCTCDSLKIAIAINVFCCGVTESVYTFYSSQSVARLLDNTVQFLVLIYNGIKTVCF